MSTLPSTPAFPVVPQNAHFAARKAEYETMSAIAAAIGELGDDTQDLRKAVGELKLSDDIGRLSTVLKDNAAQQTKVLSDLSEGMKAILGGLSDAVIRREWEVIRAGALPVAICCGGFDTSGDLDERNIVGRWLGRTTIVKPKLAHMKQLAELAGADPEKREASRRAFIEELLKAAPDHPGLPSLAQPEDIGAVFDLSPALWKVIEEALKHRPDGGTDADKAAEAQDASAASKAKSTKDKA